MITFQYRSTQLAAYRGIQGVPYTLGYGDSFTPPSIQPVTSELGVFGGNYLEVKNPATVADRLVAFFGRANWSGNAGLSVLWRGVPRFTGAPGDNFGIMNACNTLGLIERSAFEMYVDASGLLYVIAYDKNGNQVLNVTTNPLSFTSGKATDIMVAWDGTANAGTVKVSQDGVLVGTYDPVAANVPDNTLVLSIVLGSSRLHVKSNFDVNEFVVWDDAENVVYSARSDFMAATAFDGNNSTDPGVGNVTSGVGYVIDGNALTGTNVSTDPGVGNVAQGVAYEVNSVPKTGTMVNTDPGVANVKSGVGYTIASVAKVGTLVNTDPGSGNVRRGTNYEVNSVPMIGSLFSPSLDTQRMVANQPIQVTIGEDVQFIGRVLSKSTQQALDISHYEEIEAKFLKADGTSLVLKMTTGDIFVSGNDPTEFVITMTKANSALLQEADPNVVGEALGEFELVTTDSDGDVVIYDFPGSLLVQKPALP